MILTKISEDAELFDLEEKIIPYKEEIQNSCDIIYKNHVSIKSLDAMISKFQKEKAELLAQSEIYKEKVDSLMKENSQIQLNIADFKIGYRKSSRTHVTGDLDKIPDKYKREKTTVSPDKRAIARDLEEGTWNPDESIANIEIKHSIQIKHTTDETFK